MTRDLRALLEQTLGPSIRIEHEVPGGGMSRVFAATDLEFDRGIIIKVLPPELLGDVSVVRFRREILAAARLHHPNIVPVLTAGRSDDLLYYLMPWIEGATLRSVMEREGPMPLDKVLQFATDIADALAYAHAHNIVHRDIKPENVLIEGGRALVTDFGIARAVESAAGLERVTSTGLTLGTPTYMSPEQAADDAHVDGRSDIYSLGIMLHEMLTGTPPFHASTMRTMIALHLMEKPPSIRTTRPDLPEQLDTAVMIALAKSPADRYADAEKFAAALREVPRHGSASREAGPKRISTAVMRHFRRLITAVVVLVAALFGTSYWRRNVSAFDPAHVAVLNFDTPSADTTLAAAASGFTRDLIGALQDLPGLTVISPEGVAGLTNIRLDSIGRALHVGTIISGTLERRGDSLEANVRVVDPVSAAQRGSTRIRRPASQFLLMRDSVVQNVADQLRELLGRELRLNEWRSQTNSDKAWTLRQRAEQLIEYEATMRRDPLDLSPQLRLFATADSLLDAAARADERWPDPYVARAQIRVRLTEYFEGEKARAHLDTGLTMAQRALARNPADAGAHAARGQLRFLKVHNGGAGDGARSLLDSARADLVVATSADEHLSSAWQALSSVLQLHGDVQGAVVAARRALATDAYLRSVPSTTNRLIYALTYAGQASEAMALCKEATARNPENPAINTCELGVLGYAGQSAEDVRRMWQLTVQNERSGPWTLAGGISPIARYWYAAVLARSGKRDSARTIVDETRRKTIAAGMADDYLGHEAYARMVIGDSTAAIDLLRTAIVRGQTTRTLVATSPQFTPLRNNTQFRAITAVAP
jgi:serine/threonine protein kinase/tetratricopeptide (TPR) repeat protein